MGDGADFMEGWEGSKTVCFRCHGKGHWAKDCPQVAAGLIGEDDEEEPEPAAAPVGGRAPPPPPMPPMWASGSGSLPSQITVPEEPAAPLPRGPLPPLDLDVAALCAPAALEAALLTHFGFSSFRGLQVPTIQRVLRGESCLSIMPTGKLWWESSSFLSFFGWEHTAWRFRPPLGASPSPLRTRTHFSASLLLCTAGMGKSLCYQLPALLLPGLTLVVSPLVALMHDQVRAAPKDLNPAMLWGGQAPLEARRVLAEVQVRYKLGIG